MTREEREEAIDALKISAPVMGVTQEEFNDYYQTLNKIKDWLEQMPVTTTAGKGGVIYYPQVEGVTPTVIDAGKQEPCEDAISRQAVLDLVYADWKYEGLEKHVESLPSVNPQPICEEREKGECPWYA